VSAAPRRDCDVLIAGGGAVGSALACALGELPLDVVLVEAQQVQLLAQPSFDARVTALANGSQQILSGLSLWRDLAGYVESIRSIHISERGRFGAARIEAREETRQPGTLYRCRRTDDAIEDVDLVVGERRGFRNG